MAAVRRQFPSSILDLFYVDPNTRIAIPLYAPSWPNFASWSNWHANHTKSDFAHTPSQEGLYVFRVWNQATGKQEHYMLSPKHLLDALQLKSLTSMWAFSDVGVVNSLHKYQQLQSPPAPCTVVDLAIDGQSALPALKPYMSSIIMPDNVSAHNLAIWFTYVLWEQGAKNASLAYPFETTPTVTITNDDLEETEFTNNQVLFTRKKDE